MLELQLGHPTSPSLELTSEGQFLDFITGHRTRGLYSILPEEVDFDNCSCDLYINSCQHLQVSIVRFLVNLIHDANVSCAQEPVKRRTAWHSFIIFPKLSPQDTEALKDALLSNGIKPDGY